LWLLRDVGYWQILIRPTVSCEANFIKTRGGTVTDRLTGPPIMAHVSVNQSEIVTVSCGHTITTHRVQVWRGKRILCETVSETPYREIRNSTYVLKPCSLDFTVQIGPFEHLVSSHTCEDKYEFPQSSPCPSKWRTLVLHRLIQMASERRYLGTVKLIHESSEEGASRCAISVTDWNSRLSECRKIGAGNSY
jgi:hypothetical protein